MLNLKYNLFKPFLTASLLWLSSCATIQAPQPPQNENLSWKSRAQTLSKIDRWDLHALIAIRTQNSAESATLHWQQTKQAYTLLLFGPLGVNTFKLSGTPNKVALETPQGNIFYARTPEMLLAQQTGWHLPISNLFYWVRGLPAPGHPPKQLFDAYHHLTEMTQQGWTIHYLRYVSVDHIDLPSKIFLEYPTLNVKIVVNQWQID